MHVFIPDRQRELLLKIPSYTSVLLSLVDRKEAALVMRVDDLASFRKTELPIQVGFCLYRSGSGTWLVCVPFRAYDKQEDPLEGDAYLNPRQEEDYGLLEPLARQELFPFVFPARDLGDAVAKAIPWHIGTLRAGLNGQRNQKHQNKRCSSLIL